MWKKVTGKTSTYSSHVYINHDIRLVLAKVPKHYDGSSGHYWQVTVNGSAFFKDDEPIARHVLKEQAKRIAHKKLMEIVTEQLWKELDKLSKQTGTTNET